MSLPGLSGEQLLQWLEHTTRGWRDLIAQHPDALLLPCDIRETRTAGALLLHVVAVELRYAERLHGLIETPYDAISSTQGDAIFAVHGRAMNLLRELKDQGELFWSEWIEFETRSGGRMRAPRNIVYAHLILHSIRHYAQLATLLRQHGIAACFAMDYISMRPNAPAPDHVK